MRRFVPFVVVLLSTLCLSQDPRIYWEERAQAKLSTQLLTDQQLIDCLRGPNSCPLETRYYDVDNIKWTLAGRKHPDLIIAAYNKEDEVDHYLLVQTLWLMDDPAVESFMRSIAFKHLRDGIDDGSSVLELDYLAQNCDLNALARLDRDVFKKYAVMGCSYISGPVEPAWADAVAAFGRCNYVPAVQNLARSLDSKCLSAGKAEQSLKQILPGYCSGLRSVEEEQECYEKLLHPDPNPSQSLVTDH